MIESSNRSKHRMRSSKLTRPDAEPFAALEKLEVLDETLEGVCLLLDPQLPFGVTGGGDRGALEEIE